MADDLVVQAFDPVEIAKGFIALAESPDWEGTRGMSKADALDVCRAYLEREAQLAKEKAEVMSLCQTLLTNEEQICELSAALVERDAQLAKAKAIEEKSVQWRDDIREEYRELLAQLAARDIEIAQLGVRLLACETTPWKEQAETWERQAITSDAQLAAMTLQRDELTRSYDNLLTQWADVLAQLAAMTAQRDRAEDDAAKAYEAIAERAAERDELSGINSGLVKDFNAMLLANSRLQDNLTASEAAREKYKTAVLGFCRVAWVEKKMSGAYELKGLNSRQFLDAWHKAHEALAEPGKAQTVRVTCSVENGITSILDVEPGKAGES